MNCAKARCSRAMGPRNIMNRAPDNLRAVSKSSPMGSPRLTWSRAGNGSGAGLPSASALICSGSQRRTSILSSLERPGGTLSCGRLGMVISHSLSSPCNPANWVSSSFKRAGICCDSAISLPASSPFDFSCPMSLDTALRRACSASVSTCTDLRRASSMPKRSVSKEMPRTAKALTTAGKSLRN